MIKSRYGLRARVITLTLAPTLIIGLLLSALFSFNRYHDLENQVVKDGSNIIEPLSIASEDSLRHNSREAVRRIISYAHRKNSDFVRSIAVFDAHNELFVTSNYHPNFEKMMYPKGKPIPTLNTSLLDDNTLILRAPILDESRLIDSNLNETTAPVLGYIAIELDLSSLRLQQYQEIFSACIVLLIGLILSGIFAVHLMHDVTKPITNMKNVVDKIRRGHLDVRIEGTLHGELDDLKKGINAMAMSLSEYHVEMQHSIDQATSDLRETLEQLEIQNVELDIAKKRAQEAARIKSEFLANMSHELRTPLNGVIGFTRQMLKTQMTNSQKDYLQTIEKSANNLLNIINDILDFSKLEAGKLALENIPFEFQDTLEEVINLQATSAHEKGLELTLKVDSNIPAGFVGDPLRIQQILTNLMGNSIKFTEHGNIDISVEIRAQHEDYIELQFMVRDTGIGISERQQAQLFQAFSQADASISRRYGGTGLGLVITQKLVNQMDGEISLTSRLHQGSTFWFTLRLQQTDMPMSSSYLELDTLQDKSLLLIEPNRQAASVIQYSLSQCGIKVAYRSSVPQQDQHYDFILYNLSPAQEINRSELQVQLESLKTMSEHLVVSVPSTEIALADELVQDYGVLSMTKPVSRKKLLNALLTHRPVTFKELSTPNTMDRLPLTVMAVDDNPANLKLITALLKERVATVISCKSGMDAVQEATHRHFDIILMDIQMPHMDGVTATEKIRATNINSQTPIIAVTAHAMSGERDRLLKAGMDDYLTKPIEEHVLQQVLSNWNPQRDPELLESVRFDSSPETLPIVTTTDTAIDWQTALKQAAGKTDLAQDMLRMLIDYIPQVSQVVEEALADDAYSVEDLLHHVHKLHGSCAYSGVPRLQALCATLENALRAGSTLTDVEPELFELQDEMDKVIAAAQPYLLS
ncbi:MAG: two-component sensor histidine kinase BarA [Vibrio sp.]